jgi:DNA invertase Pin-like site-specific DNA recombinase
MTVSRLIGYARVSTSHQETDLQIDALMRAGVSEIVQEKSSSVGARPELRKLILTLKPGDQILVYRLDRLARSLPDLLRILEDLKISGCSFRSLSEPIDTGSPMGIFIFQILGAVAELERNIIRERSIAGQVAAIKRGAKIGRPKKLTDQQEKDLFESWLSGGISMRRLGILYGVSSDVAQRVVYRQTRPDHPRIKGKRLILGPLLGE